MTDQGNASVIKVTEGVAGYVAGSERRKWLMLSDEPEEPELQSLRAEGEPGTRRYEGGNARSKRRWGCDPVYVIAGWISGTSAGRGIVVNNDCGVGGMPNDDELDSENVGDGVRVFQGNDCTAGVCTSFVRGSKTRTRLSCCMGDEPGMRLKCGSGGGRGRRGERCGKPGRTGLIYRRGTACTADTSRDGCVSEAKTETCGRLMNRAEVIFQALLNDSAGSWGSRGLGRSRGDVRRSKRARREKRC